MVRRFVLLLTLTALAVALLPLGGASAAASGAPETVSEVIETLPVAAGEVAAAGEAETSEPIQTPIPFTAVGFTLTSGDEEVRFRTSTDGRSWGEWEHAPVMDGSHGPDDDTAEADTAADLERVTDVVWVGEARWLQVTVIDGVLADVETHLIDSMGLAEGFFDRTAAALRQAWQGATTADVAHASAPGQPGMVMRSQWGAAAPGSNPAYARGGITHGIVHHTAGSNTYSRAEAPGVVRAIQRWHQEGNRWSDIGYNFLVDRFGVIYEGRAGGIDRAVIGAHAGGWNTGAFGVSLMGNYDTAQPTSAALDALTRTIAWKSNLHGLDPNSQVRITGGCSGCSSRYGPGTTLTLPAVFGHRDTNSTACPGRNVYPRLGEIRRAAAGQVDELPSPMEAALTSPEANAHVSGTVPVRAEASSSASIDRVVFFYRDDQGTSQRIDADYHAPYEGSWDTTALPDGPRNLVVVAVDRDERQAVDERTVVISNKPPTVAFDGPAEGEIIRGRSSVDVSAHSPGGVIERVRLEIDGESLGTRTDPPYRWELDALAHTDGERTLRAIAVDSAGNAATVDRRIVIERPAYADVSSSRHYDSIRRLHDDYGIAGCGQDNFCPAAETQRGQMATFMVTVSDRLEPRSGERFADVPAGSTHAGAINALVEARVTAGCAIDRFCPGDSITRGQMATFLVAALPDVRPKPGEVPFSDVAASNPHGEAIHALVDAGIAQGCGEGRYCPHAPVTRQQMATFLVRAAEAGL